MPPLGKRQYRGRIAKLSHGEIEPLAFTNRTLVMQNPQGRLTALKHLFPVNPSEWCQVRRTEHAARVILASLAIDLGVGPAIEAQATAAHIALLREYLAAIPDSPEFAALKEDLQALLLRSPLAWRESRVMIGRVIRALPDGLDTKIASLHQAALAVENRANHALRQAYQDQTRFGDSEERVSQTPIANYAEAHVVSEALIEAGFGEAVKVAEMTPVSGGFSKQTTLCQVSGSALLPARLIIRTDVEVPFGGASVVDEFTTAVALFDAGVRVPKPLALRAATRPPFMVMEWAPGSPFGWTPAIRSRALCRELATELAKTHRIPASHLSHVRGAHMGSAERMLSDIAKREDAWRKSAACDPIVEYAFHWLKNHVALAEGSRCLVHGDYRPHNVLQQHDRVTAILDWEHAKIAHPAEDLGYVREAAEALWSWEEFLDAYVVAGGQSPDRDVLNYHEVFAAVFSLAILGQIEEAFTGAAHEPLAHISSAIHNRPTLITRLASCMGMTHA